MVRGLDCRGNTEQIRSCILGDIVDHLLALHRHAIETGGGKTHQRHAGGTNLAFEGLRFPFRGNRRRKLLHRHR